MMRVRSNLDFVIVALVIGVFVWLASQRLGTVPVPEGDEAYMAQVSYEMLFHHKIAVPMMRYLGGNIENAWHSRTPIYFFLMAGFYKLFGYGLAEGRAFNLMTAALTLLMVYLIGRRLLDWRGGLVAVGMLIGDQTFLERSRLLRNDYTAATVALLAYFLYEVARQRTSSRWMALSGLTAGVGVMCHTNASYMVAAICVLILADEGWRAVRSRNLYVFGGCAFVAPAYEIVYALADWKNFLLQNRGDEIHFRVLSFSGIWQNVLEEKLRYAKWYAGGVMLAGLPQGTLRVFQALAVVSIVFLVIACARRMRSGAAVSDPRVRIFIVTIMVVTFHAVIVSHKRIYYLAHLAPWFALCVGIMVRDVLDWIARRRRESGRHRPVLVVALALIAFVGAAYAFELASQYSEYLTRVRSNDLASFAEFKSVIRSVVPDDVCPVAVKNPSVWLAFPEKDDCFATIEARTKKDIDIDGREYALVTRPNFSLDPAAKGEESDRPRLEDFHLLGEMRDTAYGTLLIYYTGLNPAYRSLPTVRYQFHGDNRGYEIEQDR